MSSSNPLAHVLESNHLIGTNFKDWLRNLKIVLISEKWEYVLDQSPPILSNYPSLCKEQHMINGRMKTVRLSAMYWLPYQMSCRASMSICLLVGLWSLTCKGYMVSIVVLCILRSLKDSSIWKYMKDCRSMNIIWQWSRILTTLRSSD